MNYNYIVNPLTNRKCSIYSSNGQKILNHYLIQKGGACSICGGKGNKKTCPWNHRLSDIEKTRRIRNNKKSKNHTIIDPNKEQESPLKEVDLSGDVTPRTPEVSAASPLVSSPPQLIERKYLNQYIFIGKHGTIINSILEDILDGVCQEGIYLRANFIFDKLTKKGLFIKMIDICKSYYELYKNRHPLALIYANLYIDYLMSKVIMLCEPYPFLNTPKYKEFLKNESKFTCLIEITEPEYISTINRNPYLFPGTKTPTLYWDNMSLIENRKVLLKHLFRIKKDFGNRIIHKYIEEYNKHEVSRGEEKTPYESTIFDDITQRRFEFKLPSIKESDIVREWDWNKLYDYIDIHDVGITLEAIIRENSPYNPGSWGMFRLFNFTTIKQFEGVSKLFASNDKGCSCICNSLIFITILLITGYPRDCIFARMDRDKKTKYMPAERPTHWGVDIKCTQPGSYIPIHFYNCDLSKMGEICATDKNIFNRYTTDILYYYQKAVLFKIDKAGIGSEDWTKNNVLESIISTFERKIKEFVDADPCSLT